MIKTELDRNALREFKRALKDYEKKTGISIEEGIVDMARSTSRRLAFTVAPFGLSSATGAKFMESIGNQVDYAWEGSKRGVYPSSSIEAAHQAARNNRGVVRMRKFRGKPVTNNNITVAQKEIYKRKVIKRAGMAKAAYIAAGELTIAKSGKFPKITGIPKWIREDVKSRLAASQTDRRGLSTSVFLTNKIDYIQKLHKPSQVAKAIKQGYNNAIKRMNHIVTGKKRTI